MPDTRVGWCSCAFGNKIWVIGGERDQGEAHATLRFDPEDYGWELTAGMKRDRFGASCAVFEGRIVVSGGNHLPAWQVPSDSVEGYDAAADVWTSMPKLVDGRDNHSMVVTRGKLIGGSSIGTCEVLDGTSKKFVLLKSPNLTFGQAVSVRGEVFVFGRNKPYFYV